MATRNVFVEGDDILRKKSKVIEEITPKIIELLDDMKDTMIANSGVGIAAPQVGILKRAIIVHYDPDDEETYYEFINPEIIEQEGVQESAEGCLSLPGYTGIVERPSKVRIRGLNREGDSKEYIFENFAAVVVSHEMDHLEGVLYKDKAREYKKVEEEA